MNLRWSAALAFVAVTAIPIAGHVAAGTDDPLGCELTIFDPSEEIDDAALTPAIELTASRLDADVRVRVEQAVDGSLETRKDQLVRQCPGWQAADGELTDDMVVVMFSIAERETSVYYGADEGPLLENRWEPAVDAMIPELRSGDYTGAAEEALRVLRVGPSSSTFQTSNDEPDTTSSSGNGIPILVVLFIIVAVIVLVYQGYRVSNGDTTWAEVFAGDGDDSGWYSSGSRSRWRSWSSSSSGSSGGGSSGSSGGGGSRSAGGGSKKW